MRLHTDYVVDSLQGYAVVAYPNRGALPESFSRAELYLGQDAEADVLYIVDAKQLPEQGNRSFLVTAAQDSPTIPALYAAGIDAVRAFNAVTRHVAQISACLEDLRDCYYGQHDLQAFCQRLADFVGNPVVAYDDAVLPIAQSSFPAEYAHDQFGADGINYEYVFKSIPEWMKEDTPFVTPEDGFNTVGAFRTFTSDGKGSAITCHIAVDGKPLGLLDIFEANKPASGGDMHLLEEACHILEVPLPFEDNRFFESRLKGLTTQSDLTDVWLSALKWRMDDEVFVVAVNLPPVFSNSMHNLDRAMRVLRSLVPSSICVQMGAVPVLVANSRLASRQRVLDTIASFLKTTGTEYYLGASELLIGVSNLHEGYVHAQFAAQFAMRRSSESGTARFEECQFSFFRNLCSLEENKNLVLDAAVLRMHADDQAAGTDNVLTAKTYVETGFNLNATAKTVSVHRNTVAYRLKHIADRYGVDLSTPVEDPGLVFRVLLSCKLLLSDS